MSSILKYLVYARLICFKNLRVEYIKTLYLSYENKASLPLFFSGRKTLPENIIHFFHHKFIIHYR